MRHLIIGASGLVGNHLYSTAIKRGYNVKGTFWSYSDPDMIKLDIRDAGAVKLIIEEIKPDVVYVTAKMGGVDYCEEHPIETFQANVVGLKNLINAVNQVKGKVVFFSSDYIFDGNSGPYVETDVPNPIGEYGRQKLIAEYLVLQQSDNPLIVRTTVVYGFERQQKNFAYSLINSFRQKKSILVPDDQVGSPTYAPSLAKAVLELVEIKASGVYNIAGNEIIDRYTFSCEAARIFGFSDEYIRPIITSKLHQKAARPLKAGLVIDKVSNIIHTPMTGYREGLAIMASEWGDQP